MLNVMSDYDELKAGSVIGMDNYGNRLYAKDFNGPMSWSLELPDVSKCIARSFI